MSSRSHCARGPQPRRLDGLFRFALVGGVCLITLPALSQTNSASDNDLEAKRELIRKEIGKLRQQEQVLYEESVRLTQRSELLNQRMRLLRGTGSRSGSGANAGAATPDNSGGRLEINIRLPYVSTYGTNSRNMLWGANAEIRSPAGQGPDMGNIGLDPAIEADVDGRPRIGAAQPAVSQSSAEPPSSAMTPTVASPARLVRSHAASKRSLPQPSDAAVTGASPPVPRPSAGEVGASGVDLGVVAQLAAASSKHLAQEYWRYLRAKVARLLGDHAPTITLAHVNGREVWRLRVGGFIDFNEARSFCSRLETVLEEGCWVVGVTPNAR